MGFRFKRRVYTHVNSSVLDLAMTGSTALEDGRVGLSFSTNFLATGGRPPYASFTLVSGTLPTGLSIVSSAGLLSGIPSTVALSTFTIEVRDSIGSTASQSYVLNTISSGAVAPLGLSIQQSTGAPQGIVGSAYSLQINSTGGEAPYSSFSLVSGALPAGISLTAGGVISGTPSTTGTSTFTVQVRDSAGSTASQSFRLNVISSAVAGSTSAHAYFESLKSHPNIFRYWSMRAAASTANTLLLPSGHWSYVWPADGYFDAQDGMKLTKPPNPSTQSSESVSPQFRFPIGASTGSFVATWDFYFGIEFKTNIGAVNTHKEYQFADGASSGGDQIYCELRHGWAAAQGTTNIAYVNQRDYAGSTVSTASNFVPGYQETGAGQAFRPTGQGALPPNGYPVKANIWTRYWAEVILQHPSSLFTEWNAISTRALSTGLFYRRVSIWMADEVTDPQRICYRAPWRIRDPYIGKVRWEFNTSSKPSTGVGDSDGQTGTLIGYGRNMLFLRDTTLTESDTTVFKRPLR
jgi:hypothetical protein